MNKVRINVPLTEAEAKRLFELAKVERRHPREQAAYMLGCLLKRSDGAPADTAEKAQAGCQKELAYVG